MTEYSFVIHGVITKSSVKDPTQTFFDTEPKFRATLGARDCFELEGLEHKVTEVKQNWQPDRPIGNEGEPFKHNNKIFEGVNVNFETLFYPKLGGTLAALSDEELIGKSVKVLGSIEMLKDGNCYLSPNMIEEAPFVPAYLLDE